MIKKSQLFISVLKQKALTYHVTSFCLTAVLVTFCNSVLLGADVHAIHRWEFDSPDDVDGWKIGQGLKDLAVGNGLLRMSINHPDAYIFAPPIEAPLDGCMVRIKMRSDRAGSTQIYWQTDDQPGYSEQRMKAQTTPATTADLSKGDRNDGFATVEFFLGTPADGDRKLTGFRIDPINGNSDGIVEIDFVEVLQTPALLDINFAPQVPHVDIGEHITMQVKLKQIAGRSTSGDLQIDIAGNLQKHVSLSSDRLTNATIPLRFDRPGVHQVKALVRSSDGTPMHDQQTSVIIGRGARLPINTTLRTDQLRLDFVSTPDGKQVAAARWQVGDKSDDWKLAGWLLPLGQITVKLDDGQVVRRQAAMALLEHSDRAARLTAAFDDLPDWHMELGLTIVEASGHQTIDVKAELFGPRDGQLLEFSGPILRAQRDPAGNPLDRFAVFGGLEFLEPDWQSSSTRAVGDMYAERWSPHPFKITIPVMAVEADSLTTALMWQPLDKWDSCEAMPVATFASPNFLDDQPQNHLMKLSVPTIPKWVEENESCARRCYIVRENQPLTLRYKLYAEADLPVVMICKRWYEIFGTPTLPPSPHDDETLYNLLARHFGETMYWPEEKGWRHHWYLGEKSGFIGFMAGELIAHSKVTSDTQWVEKTGLANRSIIDAVGTLASQFNNHAARNSLQDMRPDGTWPYIESEHIKKKTLEITNGKYDSLGQDGSTSLGTCVQKALPILRYAHLSGQRESIDAALNALRAMQNFRVPRGAQVWEVHKDIPDIRAAALAVEAYHIGYEITGEATWLDEAEYWAWAGVPFVYSWHVPVEQTAGSVTASRDRRGKNRSTLSLDEAFQNPQRQICPFGTVPVLGPTFYVVNWFGVIVQWCGLEWAWKVIELDQDRPDPLLRYIADGVVASGLQQMFDRPPWIGLYPDVWNTRSNQAFGAFICAHLPMRGLQAQGRLPNWTQPWTRVLHDDAGMHRWHISSWGQPTNLSKPTSTGPWLATITFITDQPNELILAGIDKPGRIFIADNQLEPYPLPKYEPTKPGWRYDSNQRAVLIRFLQSAPQTTVRIEW